MHSSCSVKCVNISENDVTIAKCLWLTVLYKLIPLTMSEVQFCITVVSKLNTF